MEQKMIKQWQDLKAKHPEALLLFRCGDFYEAYCEDAKECAKILGITLTWRTPTMRHKPGDYSDAMAGFPHHALDTYLPKLVRAGKRVAICDQLEDPKLRKAVKRGISETINETSETKSEETMAKTIKAADLIGKTIVVGENVATIVIKSAEGDTLQGEFKKGDAPAIAMPIKLAQLEKMLADKVWKLQEPTPDPSKKGREKPTPNPSQKGREKTSDVKPETSASGKLRYETYTNKNNKQCARIVGFSEGDAILERETAEKLHASASYENKKGTKTYYLSFGPRYAAAAKQVCDALNAGKSIADCQAIIDARTEERIAKREEWRAKQNGQTYTAEQVAAIIEDFAAGKELPEDIRQHIKQAA